MVSHDSKSQNLRGGGRTIGRLRPISTSLIVSKKDRWKEELDKLELVSQQQLEELLRVTSDTEFGEKSHKLGEKQTRCGCG